MGKLISSSNEIAEDIDRFLINTTAPFAWTSQTKKPKTLPIYLSSGGFIFTAAYATRWPSFCERASRVAVTEYLEVNVWRCAEWTYKVGSVPRWRGMKQSGEMISPLSSQCELPQETSVVVSLALTPEKI
jgi:hypothetical protein